MSSQETRISSSRQSMKRAVFPRRCLIPLVALSTFLGSCSSLGSVEDEPIWIVIAGLVIALLIYIHDCAYKVSKASREIEAFLKFNADVHYRRMEADSDATHGAIDELSGRISRIEFIFESHNKKFEDALALLVQISSAADSIERATLAIQSDMESNGASHPGSLDD